MRALLIGLLIAMATASHAQTTPAEANIMQQLQKVVGKKNSNQALGQTLVIGSLLGCTQKAAGKEATEAFYHRMKAVGKAAEGYCRENHPAEARSLLLSTFEQNKNHAVVKSALNCYDTQQESIAALGGERMARDAANYARWLRDPKLAESELKETDVCRGSKVASR